MSRLQPSEHITAIKAARQRYNEAIVQRNADEICTFLTQDYHVVTARGLQCHGIEEQRKRWHDAFAQDPLVVYRRNTKYIRLNVQSGAAQEQGYWAGKYTAGQQTAIVGGVYAAKWLKQENGSWLVQAEVFTMLKFRVI